MRFLILFLTLFQSVACQLAASLNFETMVQDQGSVKIKYGIALPETNGTDFIAQMECVQPGWCGIALGSHMLGSILIPIWGYQGKVMSSLRWIYRESDALRDQLLSDKLDSDINNYTSPIPFDAWKKNFTSVLTELYPLFGNASYAKFIPKNNLPYDAVIKPIASETSVTETSIKFTFLCSKCITGNDLTSAFSTDGTFGYAAGQVPPPNPEDHNGRLQYHFGFSGTKTINLAKAKSSNFAKVAAQAS